MISFVIPAYNEELFLPNTIRSIRQAADEVGVDYEIIVVDNNSQDKTQEVASQLGAKVVFEPHNQIAKARNTGAGVSQGEYLLFVDADTTINSDLLGITIEKLQSGDCCGGGTILTWDKSMGRISDLFLKIVMAFIYKMKVAAGCYVFCLKSAFQDLGGFNEKLYAAEEVYFSRNLRKWGKRNNKSFCLIRDASVLTSARKFEHPFRLVSATLIAVCFPFFMFSRTLCWFWYKRPH